VLAERLASVRDAGRKAFIPYVTGGLPGVDADFLRALARSGADAVEIGIPFSDPVMDGPVIQEASARALDAGATPSSALDLIRAAALDVPVIVMTYLNLILARGEARFVEDSIEAGVGGIVVPDLPVDEAEPWIVACASGGAGRSLAPIFLAAPNTSADRLRRIAVDTEGFVYCVSTLGVTGRRAGLSRSAEQVVRSLRPLTDKPLVVGVGISTPEQASKACSFADGVVVGSVLVEPLLRGRPEESIDQAGAFRDAAGLGRHDPGRDPRAPNRPTM
jgi:tryptophan synthase alpha chain